MPYEDKYISVYRSERFLMYNATIIKEYESSSPEQFEWYLEPAGDGYFFFRWNPDRSKYLCPANQSIVQSTGLFVLPYKSPTAPAFKWGAHLVEDQSRNGAKHAGYGCRIPGRALGQHVSGTDARYADHRKLHPGAGQQRPRTVAAFILVFPQKPRRQLPNIQFVAAQIQPSSQQPVDPGGQPG